VCFVVDTHTQLTTHPSYTPYTLPSLFATAQLEGLLWLPCHFRYVADGRASIRFCDTPCPSSAWFVRWFVVTAFHSQHFTHSFTFRSDPHAPHAHRPTPPHFPHMTEWDNATTTQQAVNNKGQCAHLRPPCCQTAMIAQFPATPACRKNIPNQLLG